MRRISRLHAGIPPVMRFPLWKIEDLALLGQLPDEEVAKRTGRSVSAVAAQRKQLGLPKPELSQSGSFASETVSH